MKALGLHNTQSTPQLGLTLWQAGLAILAGILAAGRRGVLFYPCLAESVKQSLQALARLAQLLQSQFHFQHGAAEFAIRTGV